MNFISHQVKGENTMEKVMRMSALLAGLIAVTVFVTSVTQTKLSKLKESTIYDAPDVVTIQTREKQLDCLALNIYREAGYEPF